MSAYQLDGDEAVTQSIDEVLAKRPGMPTVRRRAIQVAWVGLDVACMLVSVALASFLVGRFPSGAAWALLGGMILVRLVTFIRIGMYRAVLRYSGVHTQSLAGFGIGLGTVVAFATAGFFYLGAQAGLGRAFWVLELLLAFVFTGGSRIAARVLLERQGARVSGQRRKVLIYGAGSLGDLVLRDLKRMPGYRTVGFIDDDPQQNGNVIHGVKVFGPVDDFEAVTTQHGIDIVVVAMAEPPPEKTRKLFQAAMSRGIHVLLAKGVSSILENGMQLGLRDLAMEDLLQRPSRHLDPAPVHALFREQRALVTGAGGSIGSELCRQIASIGVAQLDIVDHSEHSLYQIHMELSETHPNLKIVPHLVNLTDRAAIFAAVAEASPAIVLHAAAYKHVPLVEANPFQGVANNVLGLQNLLDACEARSVAQLLLISTDKAVRPTNVMGASKRACELLLQSRRGNGMTLCAVRFGNVLGSSGSVVPRFLKQINAGGPVTVTDARMTRYFMLIPEAVALVLQAAARSTPEDPEVFILDMGEPVKIADLARQLIFMHGKTPDVDVQIEFTGLRPGEKLFEELLVQDGVERTDVKDITIAPVEHVDRPTLNQQLTVLAQACVQSDGETLLQCLGQMVPEWKPSNDFRRRFTRRTVSETLPSPLAVPTRDAVAPAAVNDHDVVGNA